MTTDLQQSLAGWLTAGTLAPDSLRDRQAIESARADLLVQFSNGVALIGLPFVLIFWAGLGEPLPALIAFGGVAAVFATRLRDVLRDGDLAARVGGDEFALLLEGVDRRESLEAGGDVTGRGARATQKRAPDGRLSPTRPAPSLDRAMRSGR